ncbi:Glycosyl phosphatidyl inositol protein transamidase complex subunit [Ascosphaera aggregata]|nr:Glycosyl phosphatidyl inositol protein transamidase complex subunit [Ascosphaera aggregata]
MHPPSVKPLPLKSGSLQGAVAFEYPFDHRFESLHIVYDGVNGQLPNLDLFNIAVLISNGQMGIPTSLQRMYEHDDSYWDRLQTMLRGMLTQGLGYSAGLHSSFIPYHIDAITLQAVGHGWQDEMALGRTVESIVRSLNNLLEHLHQSFFFYLLMQTNRFVSIGTYLPSAMLIAGNFTIMAIALWLKSGAPLKSRPLDEKKEKEVEEEVVKAAANGAIAVERHMALPLTLAVGLHFIGFLPLKAFNQVHQQDIAPMPQSSTNDGSEPSFPDLRPSCGITLLWPVGKAYPDGSSICLERMGHVDTSRSVVRLVAGMVDLLLSDDVGASLKVGSTSLSFFSPLIEAVL